MPRGNEGPRGTLGPDKKKKNKKKICSPREREREREQGKESNIRSLILSPPVRTSVMGIINRKLWGYKS